VTLVEVLTEQWRLVRSPTMTIAPSALTLLLVNSDAFDAASFPVCVDLDGDGVGETAPIAPLCSVAAPGFAPCA